MPPLRLSRYSRETRRCYKIRLVCAAGGRPEPGFGSCCLNIDAVQYIFSGAPAHQKTAWAGRNALEGVIALFNNIDCLRNVLRPEARVQG